MVNLKTRLIFTFALLVFVNLCKSALASDLFFYKELNLIGGYSSRDHWIGKSSTLSNLVGFEYYQKFSSKYGDYLTADLQVRFAYDSSENFKDAWAFQIHNAWLEYKLGRGANVRVGHFDPAFGLEPVVDTHSTILQTLAIRDIGFKKDWGIALRGSLPEFDYDVAFQIGSGMSIRRIDGSFLVTARIGSVPVDNFEYGASLLCGKVLKTVGMGTFPKNHLVADKPIFKQRLGLDCRYSWYSYLFKGEVAYGTNDSKNVIGYLLEADYTAPRNPNWEAKVQFESWINNLKKKKTDDSTLSTSLSYKLNQKITLRAAYLHDFNLMNAESENKFLLQLYYYGT